MGISARVDIVVLLALAGTVWAAWQGDSADSPDPTDQRPALPRHELVFAGHSDPARSDYDLWRVAADGSQLASVVTMPGHQTSFSVSPDGRELLYASKGAQGADDIWRRPFERGAAVNMTNHPASDFGAVFSPDGLQMAFFSNRDDTKPELYLMKLDTGDVTRLTDNSAHDSGACWTPDGKHILFTRFFPTEEGGKTGAGEIIQLNIETGKEAQLTQLGGYNGGLDVSPDGTRVAFHHAGDEHVELWTMNLDGSNARAITDTHIDEYSPAWSPDGKWIAYTAGLGSDARGRFDLWLITPDGAHQHPVSRAANTQMEPAWRKGEFYTR